MICVYDIGNTGYEGNGNAVLQPTECKLRNVAGGGYDLTMTHPIDREGKWKHLVPGAVIKCPVPREEIENAFSGYEADVYKVNTDTALREGMSEPTQISYRAWQASSWTYVIGDKCTYINKNYVCILSDPKTDMMYNHPPDNYPMYWKEIPRYTTGAPVLVTLPEGAELYFVEDVDGTWYKMSTYYGIVGYIKKSQVTFYKHLSQTETLPRIITEQLFRIEKPTVDTKARTVTVNANHISYDLAAILVKNVSIAQASPAMAIGRITEAFMMEYAGTIATNLTAEDNGTYTNTIKGKNGIFALLDPDKGIVSTFDAAFKRDNWDLFVLKRTETDSGYKIRYRKNMLGVNWAQDASGLVTRVVPVAKDANGDDLYLPEKWVDSSRIGDYPVVRMEYLTVSGQVGKDDGTGTDTAWTEEALLAEMRTKAGERFSVDKADRVGVTVTVDFEQLGATEEYREYRGMESVLLYDTVTVINEEIGLSVQLYVSEWEWDAIRRKTTAVKLINAMNYQKGTVAGYNVQAKSISSDKLTDDVAAEILSAARDMIPEYQDSGSYGPTLANSKENDGIVTKGSGNAGKVWKTDSQGNPGWRDEQDVTGFIPTSEKGAANGVATLDSGGKVPASELPSYVDDVLEYASKNNFPATGEGGKIYVANDTGFEFRWSGSQYIRLNTYDVATQSASGLMSAADKQKLDGIEAQANKYVLPQASSSALGGIKTGWTGSGKDYPVELDSNGKAHVQVPWTDNNTTYAAGTGISISGNNNAIAVQTGYTQSGKNYPVQAGTGGLYVNVPWENDVYTLPLAANGTRGGVQIGYTETGKKYAVKLDSEKMYVEVPWTADGGNAATVNGKTVGANVPANAVFTDTWNANSKTVAGYVSAPGAVANKVWKTDANGNPAWRDETAYSLPLAANGTRGGIQIGYTQSGNNYPVQLSSEKAYVNVPWTDGIPHKGIAQNTTTDFNSLTTNGWYTTNGTAMTNAPANYAWGEVFVFPRGQWVRSGDYFYIRRHTGNPLTWGSWIELSKDTVYTLPLAASGTRGGVQVGFTTDATNRNYAVQLSGEKMYVNVPWENTWRGIKDNLTSTSTTESLSANQGKTLNDNKLEKATSGGIGEVGGNGSNNYFKLATLTITGGYVNRPVVFELSRRGYGYQKLQALFKSTSSVDPELNDFVTDGWQNGFWINKIATSTWAIYGAYNEVWGNVTVHRITGSVYNNGINVTLNLENAGTTEPSGTKASYGWYCAFANNAGYAVAAGTATDNTKVAKAGDTMTGRLAMEYNAVDAWFKCKDSRGVQLQMATGTDNRHGIYSFGYYNGSEFVSSQKWLVYRDGDGVNKLDGNAATASAVKDKSNGNSIQLEYSANGVSSFDWACVWSGYRITYIRKSDLMSQIRAAAAGESAWDIDVTGSSGSCSGNAVTASAPAFEEITIAAGASYSRTFAANSVHYMMHASNAGCFRVDIFTKANDTWWTYNSQNAGFAFSNSGRTFTITNSTSYSVVIRLGKYYE